MRSNKKINRSKPRKRIAGLSLVEVMVSIAIMSIGVLAVVGLFPQIFQNNGRTWHSNQAMLIAQAKMDEILANNVFLSETPVQDNPADLPGSSSYRKWWGEDDPNGNTNIQIVKVEVCWTEGRTVRRYVLTGAVYSN